MLRRTHFPRHPSLLPERVPFLLHAFPLPERMLSLSGQVPRLPGQVLPHPARRLRHPVRMASALRPLLRGHRLPHNSVPRLPLSLPRFSLNPSFLPLRTSPLPRLPSQPACAAPPPGNRSPPSGLSLSPRRCSPSPSPLCAHALSGAAMRCRAASPVLQPTRTARMPAVISLHDPPQHLLLLRIHDH